MLAVVLFTNGLMGWRLIAELQLFRMWYIVCTECAYVLHPKQPLLRVYYVLDSVAALKTRDRACQIVTSSTQPKQLTESNWVKSVRTCKSKSSYQHEMCRTTTSTLEVQSETVAAAGHRQP